jgi:hypothetical protein
MVAAYFLDTSALLMKMSSLRRSPSRDRCISSNAGDRKIVHLNFAEKCKV